MKFTIALFLTALLISSASAQEPEMIHGVMRYSNLEGGCWYLETDAGKKFELLADSSILTSLHVPDRMLSVLCSPAKHQASTCMIGEVMQVERIVDSVRYPVDMVVMNVQIAGRMHRTKSGKWYVRTSRGLKYLLTAPEKKYQRIGAIYDRFSRTIHGGDVNGFYGTIIGPAQQSQDAKKFEQKRDPR